MKKLSFLLLTLFVGFSINAQTADELKKEQAPKKAEITKLKGEVDALQAKIDALPGWRKGAFGTIGGNLSGFNDWFARAAPNTSAGSIGITFNGFANLIEDNFFWRNSLNVNLGWVKLDNRDPNFTGDEDFETASDVFNISSLYGKKLNSKWAISALGEYRTTLLDNFNNPGYLDLGVGITWTPMSNLVLVMHPGNYNFVFSKSGGVFEPSLGAKIVVDYSANYYGVNYKSNFSTFQSYKDGDLSNWNWTNSLGYTLWKGIGIGFELGLRKNKQEAANAQGVTLANGDNKLQSYWLFGMNYSF